MMSSDFIINATEANFEYEVLAYSQNIPVVVDFWAEWCAPCRVIGPILEKIAQEGQGEFRLAKVNVDENPNLANRYAIRSIPLVKAFVDGKQVAEFIGAQPEPQIREFLRRVIPSQSDLLIARGWSLYKEGQFESAERTFREALEQDNDIPSALLGLATSLLRQGEADESQAILAKFPTSREYHQAELIKPIAEALVNYENGHIYLEDARDAAYLNSIRLIKKGNIEAALDGLLDILRQDKHYRDDDARRMVLGLLELLGEDNPVTRSYRNELASILF